MDAVDADHGLSCVLGFGLVTSRVPGDASRLEPGVMQVALAGPSPAEPGKPPMRISS
jgi:hypothetical protein